MKNKLATLVCAGSIVLMSGIHYSLLYGNMIVSALMAFPLGLGAFGLYSMYQSRLCIDRQKRNLLFFVGVMCVLIAYAALEGLL